MLRFRSRFTHFLAMLLLKYPGGENYSLVANHSWDLVNLLKCGLDSGICFGPKTREFDVRGTIKQTRFDPSRNPFNKQTSTNCYRNKRNTWGNYKSTAPVSWQCLLLIFFLLLDRNVRLCLVFAQQPNNSLHSSSVVVRVATNRDVEQFIKPGTQWTPIVIFIVYQ